MKKETTISPEWTRQLTDLSLEEACIVQDALKKLGYRIDDPDTIIGRDTANAWADWKKKRYLGKPSFISNRSFEMLRKESMDRSSPVLGYQAINWNSFEAKISKFFCVGEAVNYEVERLPTTDTIKKNIVMLASELDRLREAWGKPIIVTSWYRPPRINRRVGGARNSQHILGLAADIRSDNIYEFQGWLDKRWDNALGYGAKKNFVHVDLRPGRIRWNY